MTPPDPARVADVHLASADPEEALLDEVLEFYARAKALGEEAQALSGKAAALASVAKARVPARVRKWDSPEGEAVAAQKVHVQNLQGLAARLSDVPDSFEALEYVVYMLRKSK